MIRRTLGAVLRQDAREMLIVTLIGWLALIKGSLLVIRPSAVLGLSRPLMAHPARLRIWAVAPLALGLFLSVKGFGLI